MVYDPFEELYRMQEEMEKIWNRILRGNEKSLPNISETTSALTQPRARMPVADVYETEKGVVAAIELPGVDKKDIDLNITENYIEVRVEKKIEKEDKKRTTIGMKAGPINSIEGFRCQPM